MSLTIRGHRLLVKPISTKEQLKADIEGFQIVRPADLEKREEAATQLGVVLQVGKTCWQTYDKFLKDGSTNPDWEPWCKVGDTITFPKYCGKITEDPVSKEKFMIILDEDVQVIVNNYKDELSEVFE